MRRSDRKIKFFVILPLLFLTWNLCSARDQYPEPGLRKSDFTITHGPYLQNPTHDSVTVIWFTNKKCVSHIEYTGSENFSTLPNWDGDLRTARSGRHGLFDAFSMRHEVTIKGLEPGKSYRYWLVSKEMVRFEPYEVVFGSTFVSEVYSFTTLDPEKGSCSFLVYQDVHGDTGRLRNLWERNNSGGIDMVFFNGDTLSHIGEEADIFSGILDTAVELFARKLPFILVRGNHDTRGSWARELEKYFPPRDNRYFYNMVHGPVCFLVMDTGEDKPDSAPVYAGLTDFDRYRETQRDWLEQEIIRPEFTAAAFRIAVFHIPPFAKGYTVDEITRLWVPLLNQGHVDLVICGHIHRLMKKDPEPGINSFTLITAPPEASMRVDVTRTLLVLTVNSLEGTEMNRVVLNSRAK